MPIAQIKRYTNLAQQDDDTVAARLEILEAHKAAVEQKIEELRPSRKYRFGARAA